MEKIVKRRYSDLPAGLYRCLKACEIYIGEKRTYVPEGKVVNLSKGEANKHFESMSIPSGVEVSGKNAAILNALDRLDEKNPAHWTEIGLPKVSVIQTMAKDTEITRKEVNVARPGFCRATLEGVTAQNIGSEEEGTHGQGSRKKGSESHQEV